MASWARWALRPGRCAECRMSLAGASAWAGRCGVEPSAAAGRGRRSQSARLGEASSRWGATLSGRMGGAQAGVCAEGANGFGV